MECRGIVFKIVGNVIVFGKSGGKVRAGIGGEGGVGN